MGFIQEGMSSERIAQTGKKMALLCAIAEKMFKEGELNEFLRYIDINESIPMATPEFRQMLKDGPVATKRARAIGVFIQASKETWAKDSDIHEVPGTTLSMSLLTLFGQMSLEEADNAKEPE